MNPLALPGQTAPTATSGLLSTALTVALVGGALLSGLTFAGIAAVVTSLRSNRS